MRLLMFHTYNPQQIVNKLFEEKLYLLKIERVIEKESHKRQ